MTSITIKQACVDFPIYNASSRSLKKRLFTAATGGRISVEADKFVTIRALHEIDLEIQKGERVGLLGHNGSGKSTLLRLLGRVYEPTSGQVLIEGSIGSLIDVGLGINPELTGLENIYLRGAILGLTRAEIKTRMDDIISFSDLGDFIEMPVRTYSSGMHLRLAFSVSTAIHAQILLMDEWLSVGDEGFRERAEQRLREMIDSTHILVIASHSKDLLLKTCNRVIWLEHGQIKMDGAPREVSNVYFGGH